MVRKVMISLGVLALGGCVSIAEQPTSVAVATPAVTQVMPRQAPSMAASDSILFWSDDKRSAAFRNMEGYFPGLEIAAAAKVRDLPRDPDPLPADLQAEIRDYMARTHAAGVMVLDDGKVKFEEYGLGLKATDRWTSFSVAKSFTSTLLGAAVRDGFITGLDEPVTQVVPGLKGTAYDGVTVGQVATMTSGVAWNEDYTDPNSDVARMLAIAPVAGESQAVTYAKTLHREAPAGSKWVYKTLETNLLGLIVEKATGKTLAAYAAEKIVSSAGLAGGMFWMQDLTGGNIGGCCLSLRLADYARFGQFVLEGGKGVVPDGWFAKAGAPQVDFGAAQPGYGYGYQWWTFPGGFGAQGIFGQAISIYPKKKLVVAIVSNWPQASTDARWTDLDTMVAHIAARIDDD